MARSFVILIGLAILAAGLFGALHNQLSYSVGASYFHDIKFPQFDIPDGWRNRVGASIVGWKASWWMGVALGLPIFGLGLVTIERPERFRAAGMVAVTVALILTLCGAMLGLALGMMAPRVADGLPVPVGISDIEGYLRAAAMHEGAYLGGVLALPVGLWIVWRASRTLNEAETAATSPHVLVQREN